MIKREPWTYYGVAIWPASWNAYGLRWYAHVATGPMLRADTKAGMRELIRRYRRP